MADPARTRMSRTTWGCYRTRKRCLAAAVVVVVVIVGMEDGMMKDLRWAVLLPMLKAMGVVVARTWVAGRQEGELEW